MERLFTSESVTAGHPDKVCDQISDAILDACLSQDSDSRVACETAINTDFVLVMGKITTKAIIDIPSIVRKTVQEIGYETAEDGFDLQNAEIKVSIKQQSSDISQGVNRSEYIGAGDQGMMFGYATDETEEYMPLAVVLAHRLAKRLEIIRKEGNLSYLRPDGKSQVTVEYGEDGYPVRVDTIVVSAQHDETVTHVPHAEGVLDMYGNNSYVELPVSEVAAGVRNTTYAEVYKELWPEGIVCALNDFARAITENSQKNIMAQQMLTISEIWKDLSEKIGSPQLIVTPERNGIRLADIAE